MSTELTIELIFLFQTGFAALIAALAFAALAFAAFAALAFTALVFGITVGNCAHACLMSRKKRPKYG
jgi:hypothetical protein